MTAHRWTEAITSSPAVVSVFDGISESAAQALCEAIEREIAPLAAQRDDLLAALKAAVEHARLALEQDSRIRDAVAEVLEQMTAALGDMRARHAEQYEAIRNERDEARADAARLREALDDIYADLVVVRSSAHADAVDACAAHAISTAEAALASTPSAEPTPRDMRVAEVTP